eukprot:SAG31_NODE_3630_length_4049_cov_2.174684_3_plen_246_part_00
MPSLGEWYHDATTATLFLRPNATTDLSEPFVATVDSTAVLVNISGTKENPVHRMAIQNLTLQDASYTYLDAHGMPSGGDWSLQHTAAITVSGSDGLVVGPAVHFDRLDGLGILLKGYNRNATIVDNEFGWLGGSCIALWGETSPMLNANGTKRLPESMKIGPDARSGNQPFGTTIAGNYMHDYGIWEKQSSAVFAALSHHTKVRHNVMLNAPRAHVNLNDGATRKPFWRCCQKHCTDELRDAYRC